MEGADMEAGNALLIPPSLSLSISIYGDSLKSGSPTGSGKLRTCLPVVGQMPSGDPAILRDQSGRRQFTVVGKSRPSPMEGLPSVIRVLHGDNGRPRREHQTGWTGVVAPAHRACSVASMGINLECRKSGPFDESGAPRAIVFE